MKVFGAKMTGGYSGGVALVAANSVEEAFMTFAKDERYSYMFDFYDENYNCIDNPQHPSEIKSCRYPFEKWKLIEGLTYDTDKPKVIIEGSYYE